MENEKSRITIMLSNEALVWVDAQAITENRSRSNYIDCLIRRAMEKEGEK